MQLLPSQHIFCAHHTTTHQFTKKQLQLLLFLHCLWKVMNRSGVLTALSGCHGAGSTWNCCCLSARSVPTIQLCTSLQKKSQLLLLPSVESDEPKWCAYTALFGCYRAGSTSNCCSLSVSVLRAPYNHAPVYTLVFHNSSSYLSVKSDRAWSLQAVLLHALEVV